MKVRELIDKLRNEEPNKEVLVLYNDVSYGMIYDKEIQIRTTKVDYYRAKKDDSGLYVDYPPFMKNNYYPPEKREVVLIDVQR